MIPVLTPALSPEDREAIRRLVDKAILAVLSGVAVPTPALEGLPACLRERGGAFVTLTKQGELRGCMGRLEAESLAQALCESAAMAATDDPRFEPLSLKELAEVEIEVSVLGRFEEIDSEDDFVPGEHGLLLTKGARRGLLLPQVATKYRLDRLAFLEALANKAGLPVDGWKDARLERFAVTAFSFA